MARLSLCRSHCRRVKSSIAPIRPLWLEMDWNGIRRQPRVVAQCYRFTVSRRIAPPWPGGIATESDCDLRHEDGGPPVISSRVATIHRKNFCSAHDIFGRWSGQGGPAPASGRRSVRVPKTPSIVCDVQVLASGRRSLGGCVRLIDRAAVTAPPRRVERLRLHPAATDERCRQEHRDTDAAPSAGRPAAADRQASGHRSGPRCPCRAPPPAASRPAAAAPPDRLPGDDPEVAPQPRAPSPRRGIPSQAARPYADSPCHPGPRPAPGPGELRVGLQIPTGSPASMSADTTDSAVSYMSTDMLVDLLG
jgi:hypothetical protein